VALTRTAAEEIRITIFFFRSFGVKKINELAVTSNKLTNNFAGLVRSGLGPDLARGPPVEQRWSIAVVPKVGCTAPWGAVGLPGGRWYHWISSSILLNKLN
jgi:hypothetical protein